MTTPRAPRRARVRVFVNIVKDVICDAKDVNELKAQRKGGYV